jgi:Domain of unknown function (DUF1707)
MNGTQNPYQAPGMRASDADRDRVIAALSEHYQAGRLTTEELDARTGQALSARTLGDLDALTTDLPGPVPPGPAPPGPVPGPALYRPARLRLPLITAVAAVAVVAIVVAALSGRHGLNGLWVLLAIPIIARRLGARRMWRNDSPDGFGPGSPADLPPGSRSGLGSGRGRGPRLFG